MSTPTAIETVRALLDARVKKWGTQADVDLDCALGSVLRDAERFQALEEAFQRDEIDAYFASTRGSDSGSVDDLAELADKLRGEK